MAEWSVREASDGDMGALAAMRRRMFEAIEPSTPPDVLTALEASFTAFASGRISDGRYRSWIAEASGRPIGSIGRIVEERPSTPKNPDGRVGYLLNVYVDPEWRRRGVGRRLVETALAALHAEGVGAAALHASEEGRAVYAAIGFEPSSEMRLFGP